MRYIIFALMLVSFPVKAEEKFQLSIEQIDALEEMIDSVEMHRRTLLPGCPDLSNDYGMECA